MGTTQVCILMPDIKLPMDQGPLHIQLASLNTCDLLGKTLPLTAVAIRHARDSPPGLESDLSSLPQGKCTRSSSSNFSWIQCLVHTPKIKWQRLKVLLAGTISTPTSFLLVIP